MVTYYLGSYIRNWGRCITKAMDKGCAASDQSPGGIFIFYVTQQGPTQRPVQRAVGYVKLSAHTICYSVKSRMHSALSKPRI